MDNFQDIPAYVLSKLNLTQDKCCCNDNETESCHGSPSGMTSVHSMEHLGEEKSTSFAEAFLAKTFLQREKELGSRANALGFGDRWQGWFAKYDQDLSLWKTPQCSLLEDYIEYSETWPSWGMMQDGACWELTTSVLHTEERESGYWHIPTPTCSDAFTSNLKSTQQKPDTMHSVSLAQLCEKMPEKMWPTPCHSEARQGLQIRREGKKGSQTSLSTEVLLTEYPQLIGGKQTRQKYPTPNKADHKQRKTSSSWKQQGKVNCVLSNPELMPGQTGQLNPNWVEWLMGWPIGWTDSKPLAMDRYRRWLRLHGQY